MEFKSIEAIPGWYSIAKKAGELYGTLDAYEKVPMYYRAINLRADALGTVPYELLRAGLPVDYPFSTPLENLIQQTERALMLVGRAFWLRLYRGRVLYGFQFINPRSVEVTFHPDMMTGADYLTGLRFTQKIDGQIHATWTAADIVYFHEPSIKNDINEEVSPARVALQSAQLAYYLERFASAFFEHGAQPALVLSLDKSITPPELERMKSHWTRYVENVGNAFKTFFFRGQVNAQIVTFPLDQMDMVPIQERAVMNIVSTFGVPRTMIEASAANYATADSDRQSFWRETIVPRLAFYERVLNEQLFRTLKYQFKFLPEKLDVFQVDEAARANSLVLLVQAGLPLAAAMKQLGYDNIEEALGLPAVIQQDTDGGVNVDTGTPVNTTAPAMPDERTALAETAQKRVQELERYQAKALARHKPGKPAAVKFTSDVLPQYMLDYIDTELSDVKKKYEIVALFDSLKLTYADMTPGEQKVYKSIVKKLEKRNIDVSQKIAAGDYSGIDTDLRNILDKSVADNVLDAGAERVQPIRGMADEQSAALIEQGIKAHGATYLDKYWNPFLIDLSATEKTYVDKVIANTMVTPGTTATDIMQQLSMFGQLRASRIAFTEPTRAASQQTMQVRDLARSNGIGVVRIWNTEKDRRVCDMCQALDGLTDDLWESVYSGDQDISQGAPAHVNCRCDTGLEYVDTITQPAETPAEELTVDEATAPIPLPAEVPLLQRDAAEIAQHIKDAVPADLVQDVADVKAWREGGSSQMYDQVNLNKWGTPEYDAAFAKYQAESARIDAIQKTIAKREETVYRTLLQDLRNPTPATAVLTFTGRTNAAQRARITELVQATVGIAPDSGTPIPIRISVKNTTGGSMGGGIMTIGADAKASTLVHESLHALQQHQQFGNAATDAFAAVRTAGEKPVSLASTGYSNGGNTYVDNTDSGYTFRIYKNLPANYGKFPEVLTTAFDHISEKPAAKDTELLELFAQIVKDGGK
jgi:HK97 family phage portal protein